MAEKLPIAAELDDGCDPKTGRRGTVRYLRNETAPRAARMMLGNALRLHREAAGLSAGEVARQMAGSPSKLSRIESGTISAKAQDLLKFIEMYKITDPEEQTQLRQLATAAQQSPWWQPWAAVTPQYLQAVVSFEDMAVSIRSYQLTYLHGLLQTPEYARALIERGRASEGAYDDLIRFRTARQERFVEASDKKLLCVVDESVLARPVGSPEIMREQLKHLITLTCDPRVQLRLVPLHNYDVHVELAPTTIFDFAGHLPTIAFAEGYDGGLVIEDKKMVDRRVKEFDAVATQSLGPHATRRRLQDLLASYRY
ncbi:helix-turn-helix domain-containing protein [Streptomyces sp. NPDC090119]|uniref:helix-turn-helix domain-containing protein n=1 Tax=Streptomyces sp. NPDC090119 TaxID=3365951 RepID=UPI0038097904